MANSKLKIPKQYVVNWEVYKLRKAFNSCPRAKKIAKSLKPQYKIFIAKYTDAKKCALYVRKKTREDLAFERERSRWRR